MDRAHQIDKRARRTATSRRGQSSVLLSIDLASDQPPTEFRIFSAGKVETTKGTFTFDAAAAKSVMAEYEAHGIDLMVDYDHASLSALSLDPAQSGKAAGWFNLEVRNGELWAVNVRWTPAADVALRGKEWRFMSPAFSTEDGRITSLLNVAITNLPATRQLQPLMAASVTALGENAMTIEEFLKVIKALGIDPTTSLDDAMSKIQGKAPDADDSSGKLPDAGDETEPPPQTAADKPMPPPEEKKEEVAASIARFMRLSGKTSFVDAVAEVETWRTSHLKLETETQKLASERATLESAERRKLCVELVSLAGRAPAAVWADDKATAPKPYLAMMPIADLRAMHADEIKASAGKGAPRIPAADPTAQHGNVTLTAEQLAICAELKCDPATYANLLSQRPARST